MDQNRRLRLFLCSFYCLILSSCHSMQGALYRVEKGDTLWSIAHVNEVEIDEIQRANPQLDIHHLSIGDKIFLPQVEHVKKSTKPKLDIEQWESKPLVSTPEPKKRWTRPTSVSRQKIAVADFQWPYKGSVISTFGKRGLKMHNGIDIQIPSEHPIKAAAKGKVVYAGDQIDGYDRIVIVQHENHFFTIYAFLGEINVHQDQTVQVGEPLAKSRKLSPSSFFHFEIRHVKTALDPQKHL